MNVLLIFAIAIILVSLISVWESLFLSREKYKKCGKIFILYNIFYNNFTIFSLLSLIYVGTKILIFLGINNLIGYFLSLFIVLFGYILTAIIARKIK